MQQGYNQRASSNAGLASVRNAALNSVLSRALTSVFPRPRWPISGVWSRRGGRRRAPSRRRTRSSQPSARRRTPRPRRGRLRTRARARVRHHRLQRGASNHGRHGSRALIFSRLFTPPADPVPQPSPGRARGWEKHKDPGACPSVVKGTVTPGSRPGIRFRGYGVACRARCVGLDRRGPQRASWSARSWGGPRR